MTDREAIEYAGKELQRTGYTLETNSQLNNGLFKILSTKFEFLVAAISALQEREERSKGCEFCNTYDFGRCGIDEHRIFMAGGNSRVDANEQFKFCPRCGRPLKGAQDESICM